MKCLSKIFVIVLSVTILNAGAPCFGQWSQQPFPANDNLFNVSFVDSLTGWVLGETSIYKTTDGGDSWVVQDTILFPFGTALYALNNNVVFYSSTSFISEPYSCGLRRTTDGGATWETVDSTLIYYTKFDFINDQIGYAAGADSIERGASMKTTNGGESWELVGNDFSPSKYDLVGVSFVNETHGWAVSYDTFIFNTTDGGTTWTLQDSLPPIFSLPLRDIEFTSKDSGWAVGGIAGQSVIAKTIDGGENWSVLKYHGCSTREVTFLNSKVGWIVGYTFLPYILKTIDGGTNWEAQSLSSSDIYGLESISMINENLGWCVGSFPGKIYKLTGVTSVDNESKRSSVVPDQFVLYQNYPNPFNPTTTISFQIPQTSKITIKVFDVLGQEVATVFDEIKSAGLHQVEFNAAALSGGVYFYTLNIDGKKSLSRKFVLIK